MGLTGGLDELSILDVLQIVAFSKKTGTLHVTGPFGQGAIVFKDGLVYCAYSPSTRDFLSQNQTSQPTEQLQALLVTQVQTALRELTGQREGNFDFELTKDLPDELDGIDLASTYLHEGIDPQGLLLGLAKEMDEERREATTLLESSFQETEDEPPPEISSLEGVEAPPR